MRSRNFGWLYGRFPFGPRASALHGLIHDETQMRPAEAAFIAGLLESAFDPKQTLGSTPATSFRHAEAFGSSAPPGDKRLIKGRNW